MSFFSKVFPSKGDANVDKEDAGALLLLDWPKQQWVLGDQESPQTPPLHGHDPEVQAARAAADHATSRADYAVHEVNSLGGKVNEMIDAGLEGKRREAENLERKRWWFPSVHPYKQLFPDTDFPFAASTAQC